MSLPPANWYADPSDPTMVRYWDGSAWTSHTQAKPQPAPQPVLPPTPQPAFQPAPQPPAVVTPQAPQGFEATGGPAVSPQFGGTTTPGFGGTTTPGFGGTTTPGFGGTTTPGIAPYSSTDAASEPGTGKRSRRGLWWGLGIAGVLGLGVVAALLVFIIPKLSPMSPDYTGAPVTASDVASEGGLLVLSSGNTVAVEISEGWVDAATYVDTAEMSVGLPAGTEWLGVWFTSVPSGTNPPELVMVAEANSQAAGIGSLSDFQNQVIGGASGTDGVSGIGDTTDVTLASGLEGKRTTVTMDVGDGMTATMVVATFGHGRRLAMVMWTSYSGPVDEAKLQALMESLRIDS